MFDVADLKSRVDLLAVVEADLGPARRHNGRWFSWPCCFHDDSSQDGGSLRVTPDTGTWFCFGCHASGDVIAWVRKRQGLGFVETCRELGGNHNGYSRKPMPMPFPVPAPPDAAWQQAVGKIAEASRRFLWSGNLSASLAYLHGRGLCDETLRAWGIGCNPSTLSIPELPDQDGKPAVAIRGITIPVEMAGQLWALKVRQPDGFTPKYLQVAGGHPALFGAHTLTKQVALLAEGEFDTMLAGQEAGDLVGVASSSGGARTWLRSWGVHLLAARTVLVAYDADQTGEDAAAGVLRAIGPRARRVTVPKGKDITEFWQAGGNVRDWIVSLLPDIPPKPTRGCPVCSGTDWRWNETEGWVCAVCRGEEAVL
jgi:DNA primase